MKKTSLILALLLTLFLASCSNEVDELSPVSPQRNLEKPIGQPLGSVFHYGYLQSFYPMEVKSWNVQDGKIEITLRNYPSDLQQAFCVVQYTNYQVLYYLQKPTHSSFKVNFSSKGEYESVVSVRVYAMLPREYGPKRIDYDSPMSYPYPLMQEFEPLQVLNATSVDGNIDVTAAQWQLKLNEVFAEVLCKTGNTLIYLQKPSDEHFVIPGCGSDYLMNVNLFGL